MTNLRVLLVLVLTATQLQAGAWPRGKGNTFVSLSYALSADRATLGSGSLDPDGYVSLMIEHGIHERYTFGLDAGRADGGEYKAVAYLSRVFGPMDARTKFALHFGGGYSRHFAAEDPLVYLGGSLGRGLDTPWGAGWAALDTTIYYRVNTQRLVTKADVTFGVNANDRLKLFVQVQGGKYPDNDPYLRVVPSMAYKLGDRQHIELGVPVDLVGGQTIGIKIGTWLSF